MPDLQQTCPECGGAARVMNPDGGICACDNKDCHVMAWSTRTRRQVEELAEASIDTQLNLAALPGQFEPPTEA